MVRAWVLVLLALICHCLGRRKPYLALKPNFDHPPGDQGVKTLLQKIWRVPGCNKKLTSYTASPVTLITVITGDRG